MSETKTAPTENGQKRITELRVSGHLMTLDAGTFCVFHAPGSPSASDNALGLPGVRISLPPGPAHNQDDIAISTFRPDGWLGGSDAAALIRVTAGPAQVLVTIYQAPGQGAEHAPRLQVLRLSPEPQPKTAPPAQPGTGANVPAKAATGSSADIQGTPEIVAHVQVVGDLAGRIGEWAGERGSRNWIEGFSILPPAPLKPEDIEYQAVLGRGWLSPWVNGGQFCGSRGMALPLLGLRLRLKGDAATRYSCVSHASFVDGTQVGPLPAGAACEAESLAPLEAFRVVIEPNAASRKAVPAAARPAAAKPAAKAQPPIARPASSRPGSAKPGSAKPATSKPAAGAKRSPPPGRAAR